MSLMRSVLLAGSESRWLRQQAPRMGFVKKAVTRFMPGEHVDDALKAAAALQPQGISTVLTQLGENISDPREADAVREHYLDVLTRIAATSLDCQISVKLTQLGARHRSRALRRQPAGARRNARTRRSNFLWIDMEQHRYVDVTLDVYKRVLADFPNVGVCLQAYLFRTPKISRRLIPLGGGVRLVKGAYKEPATSRSRRRATSTPTTSSWQADDRPGGARRPASARSSARTISRSSARSSSTRPRPACRRMASSSTCCTASSGRTAAPRARRLRIRVLIAYGDYWFPWYMRRLAERPANVWFVAKSVFSS